MEAKINIAEILKDKPQGTKLYSSACGKCNLEKVYDKSFKISFYNSKFGFMNGGEGYLDKNGKLYDDGECVVFPSKEMRDWSKFAWKKGDVLVSNDSDSHIIFKGFSKDDYTIFEGKHWISVSKKRHISCLNMQNTQNYHIEDNKEVAQTYIKTIEERLGGKLNLETLEVEKHQTEFKDGDILAQPSSSVIGKNYIFILKELNEHKNFKYYVALTGFGKLDFDFPKYGNIWNYKDKNIHYATEEEKLQLFEALAKKNKAWDAEKKAIVDLKPKWTPKPFDKIVAFEEMSKEWVCDMFSHYSKNYEDKEVIVTLGGCTYFKALPFNEETAKLIGTTKDVEE